MTTTVTTVCVYAVSPRYVSNNYECHCLPHCHARTAEFERRRHGMRDRIREMVLRPGFPSEITFAEVSCFNQQQVVMLRKKIKILIDG